MHRAFLIICAAVALYIPAQAAYDTGGVEKTILSNGITLLVRREPEAGVAAVEIFVRVGAPDEDKSNQGIGQLLAGSILAGTEGRSTTKLARLLSGVGGNFHAGWQWNYLEIYAITPPETCEETIGLLAESVQDSKLDEAAVEYSKDAIAKESRRQGDDPFDSAYTTVRRLVHSGTAYDRPYLGDPKKVQLISVKQLKEFYERTFSSDRIVISVVGDVDPQAVIRKVEICFGNMARQRDGPARPPSPVPVIAREVVIEKASPATYIMLGYPAPGVEDPDYPAMCVANVLLGGNKSSLLFRNLREERGLGYQVGSLYPSLCGSSHLVAYLCMDTARATPESLKDIREVMLAQIATLRTGSFTDDDLERAKRYMAGSHALRHERTRDRAFSLGWHEAIGLGYQYDFQYADKVKRVTRADVRRVCARFLAEPSVVILSGTAE